MTKQYFQTMQDVREALLRGQKIYWSNTSYVVTNSQCYHDKDHSITHARREFSAYDFDTNTMIVAEHIETFFGGRLHDSEVSACFVLAQV